MQNTENTAAKSRKYNKAQSLWEVDNGKTAEKFLKYNVQQSLIAVDHGVSYLGMQLHVRATDGLNEEQEASLAHTIKTLRKHTKELVKNMEAIGVRL